MYGMNEMDPAAPRGSRNPMSSAVSARTANVTTVAGLQLPIGGAKIQSSVAAMNANRQTSLTNDLAVILGTSGIDRPSALNSNSDPNVRARQTAEPVNECFDHMRHLHLMKVVVSHASPKDLAPLC